MVIGTWFVAETCVRWFIGQFVVERAVSSTKLRQERVSNSHYSRTAYRRATTTTRFSLAADDQHDLQRTFISSAIRQRQARVLPVSSSSSSLMPAGTTGAGNLVLKTRFLKTYTTQKSKFYVFLNVFVVVQSILQIIFYFIF